MTPPPMAPMLCGATTAPPSLDGWQVEPKWDGVRAVVAVGDGEVRLTSRLGNDVTAAYPELGCVGPRLDGRDAVLDGEVVALDDGGVPRFERLQRRMHVRRPAADLRSEVPVALVVFDLLWLDGTDLRPRPLVDRRAALERLGVDGGCVRVCPVVPVDDPDDPPGVLDVMRRAGLEGFVAKRTESPYLSGRRSPAWAKVKAARRREVVVGGWLPGDGRLEGRIGSLAVGWVDPERPGRLVYAGNVGSGLTEEMQRQLRPVMERFSRADSPFTVRVPGARYVEPVLVADVQFTEVTRSGTMRHPVLKGFRPDKRPEECGPGEGLGAA